MHWYKFHLFLTRVNIGLLDKKNTRAVKEVQIDRFKSIMMLGAMHYRLTVKNSQDGWST